MRQEKRVRKSSNLQSGLSATAPGETVVESRPGMPPSHSSLTQAEQLTAAQLSHLDRVLRRLHESMREYLHGWPVSERTPLRLSERLGIDRTTCQRVTSLAKGGYPGTTMLDSLPGPRAFRNLIEASVKAENGPSPAQVDRLRSAVDGLDEAIQDMGGSLSKLKRRAASAHAAPGSMIPTGLTTGLAAGPAVGPATGRSEELGARASLFHAASHLTGRHAQVISSIGLYDRVGVAVDQLRHFRLSMNHGVVASANAMPMVLESFDGQQEDDPTRWQRSPKLLPAFTSAEWKSVELIPSPGFASRAMEITRSNQPHDVCVYTEFPVPDPSVHEDSCEESWYIPYYPAGALVFDLYLHESIARQCLVSLDIHLWQTSFANFPHGRWQTRLPQSPVILQLGRGLTHADSPLCSRQAELTEEMFRLAQVDPSRYIGFRCEEHYPVWRGGYRFELDFGRSE